MGPPRARFGPRAPQYGSQPEQSCPEGRRGRRPNQVRPAPAGAAEAYGRERPGRGGATQISIRKEKKARKENTYREALVLLFTTVRTHFRTLLIEGATGPRVHNCVLSATQAKETPQRRKVRARANSGRSGLLAQGLGRKLGGRFGLMAGGNTDRGRRIGPTGPRTNRGNDLGSASRGARRGRTGLESRTALGSSLELSYCEG